MDQKNILMEKKKEISNRWNDGNWIEWKPEPKKSNEPLPSIMNPDYLEITF